MTSPEPVGRKKDIFPPCSPTSPSIYGVYAASNSSEGDDGINLVTCSAEEALKLAKKCKHARFKQFQTYEEAEHFAFNGPTITSASRTNVASEKGSPHKSLRTQDMVQFRRAIERNDLESVKKMLNDNPRYLVSCGDTPSLVHEGFRYNSLHVAAKSNCPDIADYILSRLESLSFMKYLYGEDEESDCLRARCRTLIDLYLNTPEIGFNDTPLHFASKFGHLDVVKIFLSFPECDKKRTNKYNETALDVMGTRNNKISDETKNEMITLLDNDYYVAVLRSSDLSVEAVLADPFPLQSPPSQNGLLSPDMKITALAGPMKEDDANKFKKRWKIPLTLPISHGPLSPPPIKSPVHIQVTPSTSPLARGIRSPIASPNSPCASSPNRLSLHYPETRLECIGRDLSSDCNVPWREFWSFLNCYANFKTDYGLLKLEKYLENQYRKNSQMSPISQVCQMFKDFSLNDKSEKQYELKDKSYSFIESTCFAYVKKLSDTIMLMEYSLLKQEVARLEALISSCAGDKRYSNVDFSRIHSRIALMMNEKYLPKHCPKLMKFLEEIASSCNAETKKSQTIICLCSKLLSIMQTGSKKWLGKENYSVDADLSLERAKPLMIRKMWLSLPVCNCATSIKPKISRYSSNKRRIEIERGDSSDEELTYTNETNRSSNLLKIDQNMNTNLDYANLSNGNYDSDIDDSSDESYHSAISSPLPFLEDSFDSFYAAEDGTPIFIDGTNISVLDYAVFDAVDEEKIDPKEFPFVFLWFQGIKKQAFEQAGPKMA